MEILALTLSAIAMPATVAAAGAIFHSMAGMMRDRVAGWTHDSCRSICCDSVEVNWVGNELNMRPMFRISRMFVLFKLNNRRKSPPNIGTIPLV